MPLTNTDWQAGEGPLSQEGGWEGTNWPKVVMEGAGKLEQEE